jgi:hypothetical protein
MSLPTVADAARNNAEWCDVMCRAHGPAGSFGTGAWSTATRSPLYYPDAVTLTAQASADEILAVVDANPGCSVKDSYATLDLTGHGFHVLFAAEWIGRSGGGSAAEVWPRVAGKDALRDWESAWAHPDAPTQLFLPALLGHPNVLVVGDESGGAVLNRSANAVGVSNLFDRTGDVDAAWHAALAAANACFPGIPVVGYESGDDLATARRHDFVTLGALRVWMKD